MKIIIGLGNPGERYQNTRHNLGFMVVDEYAKKHLGPTITWEKNNKINADILKIKEEVLLVKPLTSMNSSGQAVKALINFLKLDISEMVVVYDELDLPLGKIKIRQGGAAAGHHGVESIINILNTDQFIRLRLGIGNLKTKGAEHSPHHFDTTKFVVDEFISSEKTKVKHMLKQALEALDLLINEGLDNAQNQYN